MAMNAGSVYGTWPAISGSGLAGEIWEKMLPLITPDINSIVDANGLADLAGQDAAAQKTVILVNAIAQAIIPHLIDNMELDGAASVLSVTSTGNNVK